MAREIVFVAGVHRQHDGSVRHERGTVTFHLETRSRDIPSVVLDAAHIVIRNRCGLELRLDMDAAQALSMVLCDEFDRNHFALASNLAGTPDGEGGCQI